MPAPLKYLIPFLLILFNTGFCQTGKSYLFHFYDNTNGLSSYNVRKIVQDDFGFMWIATQDGLNFFDGKSFRIFRNSGRFERRIADNAVMDMAIQPGKSLLWLCLPYAGIQVMDMVTHRICDSIPSTYLDSTLQNSLLTGISFSENSNAVWIAHSEGWGVFDTHQRRMVYNSRQDPHLDIKEKTYVVKVVHSRSNLTWVCTRTGRVYLYQRSPFQLIKTYHLSNESSAGYQVNDVIEVEDQKILIATSSGLQCLSYQPQQRLMKEEKPPLATHPLLSGQVIRAIYKDVSKNVWIGTTNQLLCFRDNSVYPVQNLNNTDFPWQPHVNTIFSDRLNHLWVGSRQGLAAASLSAIPFTAYKGDPERKLSIRHVFNIYVENDSLLFYAAEDGIFNLNTRTGKLLPIATRSPGDGVFEGPHNNLILSNHDGLWLTGKQQPFTLSPAAVSYPELAIIKNENIATCLRLGDSVIILGSDRENGIFWWNYKKHTVRHFIAGKHKGALGDNTINSLALSRNKDCVLVGGDKNITILNISTGQTRVVFLGNHHYFFDIKPVGNLYYIASYETGLLITDSAFRVQKVISINEGLSHTGVYRVEFEGDSAVWVSSNEGLNRISLPHLTINKYYQGNGLHSSEFEEFSSTSWQGKMYMGGVGGITAINPAFWTPQDPDQPLYFTLFHIQYINHSIDSVNLATRKFVLPSNVAQFSISFEAPDYLNNAHTSYQYKIDPIHDGWIDLGEKNQVDFPVVAPGSFNMHVRASRRNGGWGTPQSIMLIFLPKWYQTLWFKALVFAVVFGILYSLYRFRIHELKKQQQVRKNIASDLHDDIGSTLNSVKLYAHLASVEHENKHYLEQIKTSLAEASTGLRETLWVLDDSQDTMEALVERIRKFADPLTRFAGVDFQTMAGSQELSLALSKSEKRNLLLIAKETINNSIKYSGCTIISLRIQLSSGKLTVILKDNGTGFDQEKITPGNGLGNIHFRAGKIKFKSVIHSSSADGTTVILMRK